MNTHMTDEQAAAVLDATDRWLQGLLSYEEARDLMVLKGGFTPKEAETHLKKLDEED